MSSPTVMIFIVIGIVAATFLNCLHFVGSTAAVVQNNNNNNNSGVDDNNHFVVVHADDDDVNDDVDDNVNNVVAGRLRRIDITRKHSVQLNGLEIDEKSLLTHLADHERELIFGKSPEDQQRHIKLVHLIHRPYLDDVHNAATHVAKRVKRSDAGHLSSQSTSPPPSSRPDGAPPQQELAVQLEDNAQLVNLRLHQTPKLIDDAFVLIRRYANRTQFIAESHKLAEQYARCFYSNENSALDLCDDTNVRGVLHHNDTDYIIHPLPARFGNATHILMESDTRSRPSTRIIAERDELDENMQFEPDEMDFNELSNINSTQTANIEQRQRQHRHGENRTKHHQHQQQPQQHQHKPWQWRYKPRYHLDDQQAQKHRKQRERQQRHHERKQQQQQQQRPQHHQQQHDQHHHKQHKRQRRHISSSGSQWKIPKVLHIETAIFVDRDLFQHMAKNYPTDTQNQVIRFVLAMINGVQLLYHHPTLGHRVNFVLKRLEILHEDPSDLRRSRDIDQYLSSFCMWQSSQNPPSDADSVHFDHAVILTGLDLYVIGKNGQFVNQVVGLAPVAGMCTRTSSCTINEGKHFESVFVVAHEIGHNLGMRHDTNENSCNPTQHIMSPTLGSGKITWSQCSRSYLNNFLDTPQARCLFDRGQFLNNLDHAAEGLLPGERFDAVQQCMLKYGKDAVLAKIQHIGRICVDLLCQRDYLTWTSHPALEGTRCGDNMWCRSGECVARPTSIESHNAPKQFLSVAKPNYDKTSFVESNKINHVLHEYNYNKSPTWGDWSKASDCASSCLYGPSNRLREGSTGLKTYTRQCLDYQRRCMGRDRKFESCVAQQCYTISIITIEKFGRGVCEKAQKFDDELTGEGEQIVGDIEESCKVICKTKTNGNKSRNWTFPDGTTCRSKYYNAGDTSYCIGGRCEKFSCDNATNNYYKIDPIFCQRRETESTEIDMHRQNSYSNDIPTYGRYADWDNSYNRYDTRNRGETYATTTKRSKYENEVVRGFHGQSMEQTYKRKMDTYSNYNKYNYNYYNDVPQVRPALPMSASLTAEHDWIVKSGCYASCMAESKGIQVISNRRTGASNIQLCTVEVKPCEHLSTTTEYAENTCLRYKPKVRGLSGHGTQIAASVEEPDRSCRVGCQHAQIKQRFYLVNGKHGLFPLGTRCSKTQNRYCVNGKCLEFGLDNIPLEESHISLALYRNRRSIDEGTDRVIQRQKRNFLYYDPVNITRTITQEFLNGIVNSIIEFEGKNFKDEPISGDHIDLNNPIYMSTDELITN